MTKQLIKGMTMLLLIVALAFVTAVAANAQSNANVPFEFVVGSKSLPAGHYRITNATAGGQVVRIASATNEMSVFNLAMRTTNGRAAKESKLVFHRYGNRYFLAEIWRSGETEGQKLLKSREEKAIERELASIASKSELAQRGYERIEIALVSQ